jgi:hypothetical protein
MTAVMLAALLSNGSSADAAFWPDAPSAFVSKGASPGTTDHYCSVTVAAEPVRPIAVGRAKTRKRSRGVHPHRQIASSRPAHHRAPAAQRVAAPKTLQQISCEWATVEPVMPLPSVASDLADVMARVDRIDPLVVQKLMRLRPLRKRRITGLAFVESAAPEMATWLMLVTGFGLVGGAMRMRMRRPEKRLHG